MFHILNGDAVVASFESAGFGDEYAVWRELYCQGPTLPEIHSASFIRLRQQFLNEFLGISPGLYDQQTTAQWTKIRNHAGDEVTLWFEYDLFCQINMMVAINLLHRLNPADRIFLVTVGKTLDDPDWITLGHLKPGDWQTFYDQRRLLDHEAIDFMKKAWEIYCSPNHQLFDSLMTQCPPVYKYFPQAIENHYRRFASREDGLTDIQRFIFKCLDENISLDERILIKNLIRHFHYYGYGDLQFKGILKSLEYFIEKKGRGYRLRKKFTGSITEEESQHLPVMVYGGQSNKGVFLEDFIEI